MRTLPFFVLALPLTLLSAPALAQPNTDHPPASTPEDEDEKLRSAYISISPLHLLFPIVEVTAEARLHRKIGVAGIFGVGSMDPDGIGGAKPGFIDRPRYTVWEVGGQFITYPVGNFDHGMQLGAEVLYVGVAGSEGSGASRVAGTGEGLAMGPLLGYKLATKVGFSFNVQGGVQYVALRADASSTTGATATATQSAVIPLLNINVGWSF